MSQLRNANPSTANLADDEPVTVDPPAGSLVAAFDLATLGVDDVPHPDLGGFVYPRAVSALYGEPATGKSFIAAGLAVEAVARERVVLIVDYEDVGTTWARRLRGLGLADKALRDHILYYQPQGPFDDADLAWFQRLVAAMVDPLVIVDSSAESMAAHGLDEDSAADTTGWFARVARPLARAGASVLLLDHTAKSKDRGRWARGSGAKLAAVDGCAVMLEPIQPFARGSSGVGQLVVSKDRHGLVGPVGAVVATVNFSVLGDAVHAVTIRHHDPAPHSDPGPQTLHRRSDSSEAS